MTMKQWILLTAAALLAGQASAQLMRAEMDENFRITAYPVPGIENIENLEFRDTVFEQLPGFPKALPANATSKNLRNITLADLDGDGVDDILWGANNKLQAYSLGNLLWERTLSAVAIYPPSVGDIDGDGQEEIVLATGGIQVSPRLYAFEKDGTELAGWPVNLNNNWILTAPALSDLDGDGALEVVATEYDFPIGYVHILKGDGSSFSSNWPVALDAPPAVTPSIGDMDGDGEKDIVMHSTTSRYIFGLDGQPKPGFPIVTGPTHKHSYQSPVLISFDEGGTLEAVGASHGDAPEFYIIDSAGAYRPGWPIPSALNIPTFSTPTVVEIDGEDWIFMSRTLGAGPGEMLFAWDADGNIREGFPIFKMDGCEGIISVADIDDDGQFELVFGSVLFVGSGPGFIHAYELDGTPVDGFPLHPRGLTYLNGAALSDVNGDGLMDLVALSYTLNFGAAPDTAFLNAYNLNVPYSPERVLWGTYKGSNTRDGLLSPSVMSGTVASDVPRLNLKTTPNPAQSETLLSFTLYQATEASVCLTDASGRERQLLPARHWPAGPQQARLPLNNLPPGLYWISIRGNGEILGTTTILIR